ncbi:hypothetical protein C8R44DRAFT_729483 [Mycena epipterygia]|nr:hypothetical protein C8R44DRAFT_729483 [Mycena epipterygia]
MPSAERLPVIAEVLGLRRARTRLLGNFGANSFSCLGFVGGTDTCVSFCQVDGEILLNASIDTQVLTTVKTIPYELNWRWAPHGISRSLTCSSSIAYQSYFLRLLWKRIAVANGPSLFKDERRIRHLWHPFLGAPGIFVFPAPGGSCCRGEEFVGSRGNRRV